MENPELLQRVVAKHLRQRTAASFADAEAIRQHIAHELEPVFKGFAFSVYSSQMLGGDGVSVDFFRAPHGAPNLDLWNAPLYIKVSLDGDPRSSRPEPPRAGLPRLYWYSEGPTPEKLQVIQNRARGIKFRSKTGPATAVVNYVVQWFKANADILKGE